MLPSGHPRTTLIAVLIAAVSGSHVQPARGQEAPTPLRIAVAGTPESVEVIPIPGGTFRMGSPADEGGRDPDEGPVHDVSLGDFWITTHEISQRQYRPYRLPRFDTEAEADTGSETVDAVTRPSPPYEDPTHGLGGEDHPMTGVTRRNALEYARWLSLRTGRLFRLPTEAEWEYACRMGHPEEGSSPRAGPVPTADAPADDVGIRHMLGNVAEWVLDGYVAGAYDARHGGNTPTRDPVEGDPIRGRGLTRGGSFDDPATERRCAARLPEAAAWKRRDPQIPKSSWWNTDSPQVGFRLVMLDGEATPEEVRRWFADLLGG